MTVTAADTTLKVKGKVGDPFSSPWRRRLPLLPALIFMIAVTQLPFLVSIYYSFTNLKDKTQSLIPEPTKFVGIDNYRAIFDDPFFRQAMWTSVKMTVLAVVLSLVFGTLFAILLDRKFFGQGFVRTLPPPSCTAGSDTSRASSRAGSPPTRPSSWSRRP